jgi:hypothetical protein
MPVPKGPANICGKREKISILKIEKPLNGDSSELIMWLRREFQPFIYFNIKPSLHCYYKYFTVKVLTKRGLVGIMGQSGRKW